MILEGILFAFLIGGVFFVIFNFFDKRKFKKIQKNYNQDEDKSKQGEERRGIKYRGPEQRRRRVAEPKETELLNAGLVEPKGKELLPSTGTGSDGETISSDGETISSPGKSREKLKGLFRKLRKK